MIKRILCTSILLIGCALLPQTASAHVLTTDETKQIGAVLHLTPDDDPVAGEPSKLLFDIQGASIQEGAFTAVLTVTDDNGQQATIPTTIRGFTIAAEYIFPAQGAYEMTLAIQSPSGRHAFTHAQRVSRGLASGALDTPQFVWAEALLAVSGSGLVLLGGVAFSRRKEIAVHSKE